MGRPAVWIAGQAGFEVPEDTSVLVAEALLLPHVIRRNGTVTHKATPWPKAETYRAPERYQDIARMLGLPAATPEEGVESYARAVEELMRRAYYGS